MNVDWQVTGGIESLTQTTFSRFPCPSHKFLSVYLFEKKYIIVYIFVHSQFAFLSTLENINPDRLFTVHHVLFAGLRVFCPLLHLVATVLVHMVAFPLFLTMTS